MPEKEYIEREAALKYLYNSLSFCENELDMGDFRRGCIAAIQDDIGNISNIPTADVAEVVRCKDCKHSYFIKSCSKYECKKGCGTLKYSNDFCSYGERKTDDLTNSKPARIALIEL